MTWVGNSKNRSAKERIMAKAIVLTEYGGSDVMSLQNVDIKTPGAEEILIRQTAIGVHFHDIYVRSGLYKTLSLP